MIERRPWIARALGLVLIGVIVAGVASRFDGERAAASGPAVAGTLKIAASDEAKVQAATPTVAGEGAGRALLKPARRDPFQLQVSTAPSPAAAVAHVPVPAQAAPVMPSVPPLTLAFTGRMLTSDGRLLVQAQWGDGTPVTLFAGKDLGNGYRVERMSAEMVELLNPQTQALVQLPLPPMPRFETR